MSKRPHSPPQSPQSEIKDHLRIKYPQNLVIVPPRAPLLRYTPLKTGVAYDARMRYHAKIFTLYSEYIDPHPEDPRRIYRIYKTLAEAGLITDPTLLGLDYIGELMTKIPVREASDQEILEVHTQEHLDFLRSTTTMSKEELLHATETGDLVYFNHDLFFCARLLCGGVIEACKAVVEGRVKNALAIVRPPGHHSEPEAPGGFCLFSNVAVAARAILKRYPESVRRVVIVDWDVHHGNGTQKCFYDDPNVLYISLHRYEPGKYYPGTPQGAYDQAGEGKGAGFNINIPWPQGGMGDADYMYAFTNLIMPVCWEFSPDLVIVSSGFDAADGDTIGQCHVSPGCYGHMVAMLKTLARGHLCVALEGGYNLDSISISALAVAKSLLGEPPEELKTTVPCSAAVETVYKVREFQLRFWKCLKPGFGVLPEEPKSSTSLADAIRMHQATLWKDRYGLMPLPVLVSDEQRPVMPQDQFLALTNIFDKETVVVLVHDPSDVYGHVDPVLGTIEPFLLGYVDPTEKLVEWALSKKYGFVDVIVPIQVPGDLDYNNVTYLQEVLCYLWDNYLKYFKNMKSLLFFGVGESYNGVVHLLGHRNVVDILDGGTGKVSTSCSINFLSAQNQLRLITPLVDDAITDWFYKNSLVFTAAKHPIWENNDNYGKRPRKKFGRVLKSESGETLGSIVGENFEEAVEFVEDVMGEYSSEDEEENEEEDEDTEKPNKEVKQEQNEENENEYEDGQPKDEE